MTEGRKAEALSQQKPQEDPLLPGVVFEEAERTGGVGLSCLSYDDIMKMGMAGDDAGAAGVGAELLQPQQADRARAEKLHRSYRGPKCCSNCLSPRWRSLVVLVSLGLEPVRCSSSNRSRSRRRGHSPRLHAHTRRLRRRCISSRSRAEVWGRRAATATTER